MVYSLRRFGDYGPMNPLALLSVTPPAFNETDVAFAVARQFGLEGKYQTLVSERDQNFCLETAEGDLYVVKVTSAVEDAVTTDFQVGALLHLASTAGVNAPRVVSTIDGSPTGEIADGNAVHTLRVVSWVRGQQLQSLTIDEDMAERFGAALARLDKAFEGYSHTGENPVMLWDLQRVLELRPLLECIDDRQVRRAVTAATDDFEQRVVPEIETLRTQVIHGDSNPENVLVTDAGIGFIDFSDIVRAPRIFDVAIAASYLRTLEVDPTTLIRPFIAGYQREAPLDQSEVALLFDLVRGRLVTTITLLYWRLRDRPEKDEYRQKSLKLESSASHFLAALDRLGRTNFTSKISTL